jgi:hypothetical protein
VCTITEPLADAVLTAGQPFRLVGRCSDPETGRVRSGLHWHTGELELCSGAMCDATLTSDGPYALTLCAPDPRDAALEGCTDVNVQVTLPPEPTVSIDSITQSGSETQPFTSGPTVTLTGSASGQGVQLIWFDTFLGSFGNGTEQVTMASPLVGRHTVILTATDNLGRSVRASASFVVVQNGGGSGNKLAQTLTATNTTLATGGGAHVDALARDSTDFVLVANPLPGIYRFDGTANNPVPSVALTAPSLTGAVHAMAISEADGNVYLGTAGGLTVCGYTTNSGIGSCTTHKNGNVPDNDVLSVARARADGSEYLLAGTAGGLFVTSNVDGSNSGQHPLDDRVVTGLAADGDGNVWVATRGDGLWRYDVANDEPHRIDGGPSSQLSAVAVDAVGMIWDGSDDGIGRYEPEHDRWTVLRTDQSPEPGLVSDTIRCLTTTRVLIGGIAHDVVWFGTDKGVSRIDSSVGSLMNMDDDDGLPSASVRAIVVLGDGSKLIGTDSGIARYSGL